MNFTSYIGCLLCCVPKESVMNTTGCQHIWTEIKIVEGWKGAQNVEGE